MRQLIAATVLLSIIVGLLWLWQGEREHSASIAAALASTQRQVTELETKVLELQEQALQLEETVAKLQKNTPEGLLDRANRTFLDGWESFVGTVQEELDRVREKLDEQEQPNQPDSSTDDTADTVEDNVSDRKRT